MMLVICGIPYYMHRVLFPADVAEIRRFFTRMTKTDV